MTTIIVIGGAWISLAVVALLAVNRAGRFLPSDTPTDYPKKR